MPKSEDFRVVDCVNLPDMGWCISEPAGKDCAVLILLEPLCSVSYDSKGFPVQAVVKPENALNPQKLRCLTFFKITSRRAHA